ncbi:MAG: M56 family metallopeptidase, partial [Acidobacteriota bacterium]
MSRPLALAIGWAIVQSLWQITLVAVFSAAALAAARRATANVRYAIAVTGLGVMLAWPAATARDFISVEHHTPVMRADIAPVSLAAVRQSTRISRAADQAVPGSFSRTTSGRMDRFLPYATLIWAIGVVVLAIRAVGGWAVAQRLRRHGIACPTVQWQARFDRLLPRLRIGKRVTLLQSQLVDVPTVIGWLKPVVLAPASAFAGLAPQQLEAILVHELAHIRRQDYLANLVQTVVETLLFYHPAAWWLSRVARAEREHCCDDVAVAMVGNRVEYARALADLEVVRRAVPSFTLGADGGSLLHRVSRVLGAEDAHDRRRPDWVVSAVALVAIAVVLPGLSAQSAPSRTSLSGLNVQPAQSGRTASPPPVPPAPPTPPAPPVAPSVPAYNVDGKGCISNSSPAGKWEACYSG